jgi:transposase-like protein
MQCPHCDSANLIKRGSKGDHQRYMCKSCGRYCTDRPPRFSAQTKAQAVDMYLNNVGIRKIARFVGASPAGVLRWIRKAHADLQVRKAQLGCDQPIQPDIIEMDEIYTYVQKNSAGP